MIEKQKKKTKHKTPKLRYWQFQVYIYVISHAVPLQHTQQISLHTCTKKPPKKPGNGFGGYIFRGYKQQTDANYTSEMEKVLTKCTPRHLSTYAAIIVMFTYSILLDRDFECTCKPLHSDCNLYMALPVFIIFVLILCTDKSFQAIFRYTCCCGCRDCCHFWRFFASILFHIFKAALVGGLWTAFVLLDGDWYVCCMNDHSEKQAQLACKAVRNITDEDRIIIAELKNESRVSVFLFF